MVSARARSFGAGRKAAEREEKKLTPASAAPPHAAVTEAKAEREARGWVTDRWNVDLTVAEWWALLAAARYAAPQLPAELGGLAYDRSAAQAVRRVLGEKGCLGPPPGIGIMLAAPTIGRHGSPEQIRRLVPPILRGQTGWCQLFSEPNAGSDLAGLQCRAEWDGSQWIVHGQKVWTSGGQVSDMALLVARTDPAAPKHRGLSYFALSMDQPGIDVRPLREMSGRSLFNEVIIDGARVSDEDRIGALGDGWTVANTTLTIERETLGTPPVPLPSVKPGPIAGNLSLTVADAVAKAQVGEDGVPRVGPEVFQSLAQIARRAGQDTNPIVRAALVRLYVLTETNRIFGVRALATSVPGHGNMSKLALSELYRQFREVGNLVIGADGMLGSPASVFDGLVQEITVFSPGPSIYGGTDQIQRNLLAERVLGLPKEPGPPSSTPFDQLPKN